MSIDSTRPIRPLSPLQGSETGTVQSQKNKTVDGGANTTGGQTQVNLSDAQARLRQPSSQDINAAKVASLKQDIAQNKLKIDIGKVADAVIAQAQSMLDE